MKTQIGTQSVTKTQMAVATFFLGASMLAAAGAGLRMEDRSRVSVRNDNTATIDLERNTVKSRTNFLNVDLESTDITYNSTKNFVDFEKYAADVVAFQYKNVGNTTNVKPFNLKVTFDRSVHLSTKRGQFINGIEHIVGNSEHSLVSIKPEAKEKIGELGVYPGEGSVTIENTVKEIFPEDTNATEFVLPITNSKAQTALLNDAYLNRYELAPGESGYAYIIIPKFYKEEIENGGLKISMKVESEGTIQEFSLLNNEKHQSIHPLFATSQLGFCPGFGECFAAQFGACSNFFSTESKCEAFVDSL